MPTNPYLLVLALFLVSACTPRIELAMPSEPITINLNVKIDHEIRIKIDKELDDLFDEDSGLF
ncbi:YnbE family lipoprotein [Psychromonas hadalis]|uniref:YnbE family lipoprotein n=1 Tax=Psychromonas hadalis TaxID=211669 RepID=UPI0003B59E90|nr:YnbE family lipoprotein [Psychromonas hadalis]